MKTIPFALAGLAGLAATVQAQVADIKSLIIGGKIVPAGTKTYTTGLRVTADGRSYCGGMLITPNHVLSAAHCSGVFKHVAVGTHFKTGAVDGERLPIKKEHVHPLYDMEGLNVDYDISVIELATPSTIPPVKLLSADPETLVGAKSTALGWGYGDVEGGSPELLRVDVPVVSDTACKAAFGADKITPRMFCAGGERNKDACSEDSGGPLVLERATGDVVIGVVSLGAACGTPGKPGVYTRVSVLKDWILSIAPNATFV